MANGNGLLGMLGGLGGGYAAQQQELANSYNAYTGTTTNWNQQITLNYDFNTDTVAYVRGAERRPALEGERRDDSALAWLDRRVNEVRVRL